MQSRKRTRAQAFPADDPESEEYKTEEQDEQEEHVEPQTKQTRKLNTYAE
jgi:hypothetical protein